MKLKFWRDDKGDESIIPKPEFPATEDNYIEARRRLHRNVGAKGKQVDKEVLFDLSIIQDYEIGEDE